MRYHFCNIILHVLGTSYKCIDKKTRYLINKVFIFSSIHTCFSEIDLYYIFQGNINAQGELLLQVNIVFKIGNHKFVPEMSKN